MNRLLNRAWLLVFAVALTLGLASCAPEDDSTGTNGSSVAPEHTIYAPSVDTVLVLGDGIGAREVDIIQSTYHKKVGKEIPVVNASALKAPHEIVVGETDRDISVRAYRLLYLMNCTDEEVGYLIYSDGSSVAIAFDDAYLGEKIAFSEAVNVFVKDLMVSSSLQLEEGIVCRKSFYAMEWQEASDDKMIESIWGIKKSQLSSKINSELVVDEIITSLQKLRGVYSDDYGIVTWLANLYDPETGGFYYSNSARNNIGYLPDLESTAHALGLVKSILTGYGGNLTDYFGEEIAAKFAKFVRDMQDKNNGYFYHPQWSKDTVDKNIVRRDRDLDNAISILESFGALPVYDTPNGVKGDGGVSAVSRLLKPLSTSRAVAVAMISSPDEDEIYVPPHLSSAEMFNNYLSGMKFSGDPYKTASELELLGEQICMRDKQLEEQGEDYRLTSILTEWLEKSQNKSTGLWGYGNDVTGEKLKALYKIASLYNKLGKVISDPVVIVSSVSDFISAECDDSAVVGDVSDSWSALSAVVKNVEEYSKEVNPASEDALIIYYSSFAKMISSTVVNIKKFLKEDGSFSSAIGLGNGLSYGMSVSPANMDEGNISATLTAVKTIWLSIFDGLDIGSVPVFTVSDRMIFQKTLLDMGVIIKNQIIESDPLSFEDDAVGEQIKSAMLTLSDNTEANVIKYDEEHGNVLNIKSKDSSSYDMVEFGILSSANGASCNVSDLDMCVLPGTENGSVMQIALQSDMYMLTVSVQDGVVKIMEDSSRSESSSFTHDLGIRAGVGEWFNLRIEYYNGSRDTVRIKVFFNDVCVAVTNNWFSSYKLTDKTVAPADKYYRLRFRTISGNDLDVLVDNIVAESNYRTYMPETNSDGKLVRNVDAPESNKKVYDFSDITDGALPDGFVKSGGSCGVVNRDGQKELALSSAVNKLLIPLDERGTLTNSALVEFDATVALDTAVGAEFTVNFNEYLNKGRNLAGFKLIVAEDNQGRYVTVAESLGGLKSITYDDVRLPLGESFVLRAHLFFDESAALLMINNTIVGLNGNVLKELPRCYMGEVSFASSSKNGTLYIDNLVCERIAADYEIVSAPTVDRVVYSFDTSDGIELSGVSVSDGVASFANANSSSYLRIPVNNRSSVASLGIVKIDVQKIADLYYDLVILLTDSLGREIAAFALTPTEAGADIYEYTENGRYSQPIGSVDKTSFTLGIEYNSAKESINILVDEKYAASTSVTYTPDSSSFNFAMLEIRAFGPSGFTVDNAVAETVVGIFVTPVYDKPNQDNSDELVTYEHSSFASLPKLFTTAYLKTSEARMAIKESIVKSKVSRVLEFTTGAADTDVLLIERLTKKLGGTNAVAFETDLMLSAETANLNFEITLKPRDLSACSIYVGSYNGKIKITSSNLKVKDTYLDVKDGEWFNIRIEYTDTPYDFDYNEVNDVIIRIYINGILVADGIKSNYPDRSPSASTVDQVRFGVGSKMAGKVFFDNTIYEQCNMEYEAPLPPDTHTLTFEPGVINKKVAKALGTGSSLSVVDMTVAGQVGKVLELVTAKNASDKLDILVTEALEGANALCFETDIMISPTSNSVAFTLEPLTAREKQPFSLNLTANKGGKILLSAKGIPEFEIGNSGEWIHLKIEYMNPNLDYDGDGERDILLKIYLDNSSSPTVVGLTPYSSSAHYDSVKLERFRFKINSDAEAKIYLDNTKFWQINLTPDEGGTLPIPKDDEPIGDGSGSFGKDDWA